ncbi:MAG: DNA-binding protein [Mycobacterium sp.]|nr:MAG: DNA-binding protein [Mycobacterium sp.]
MTQADELIGAPEVAALMGVETGTVYTARHAGRGPVGWKRGRRLVFRRSDVEAFLARERETSLRGQGVVSA